MRARHRFLAIVMVALLAATSAWVPIVGAAEPGAAPTAKPDKPQDGPRTGTTLAERGALAGASIQADPEPNSILVVPYDGQNIFVSPLSMAQRVVGGRGTITNATFTGAFGSAGEFYFGGNTFLVNDGILLSSGHVDGVLGPNVSDSITTDHNLPGDADLDTLIPEADTHDAAILEFDMVPHSDSIAFDLVFASDEYNEYANSGYNDVFGFFVGGQNIAHLPGTQTNITINSINGGNPLGTGAVNPNFYINNDLQDGGTLDTEMDGMTTVIHVSTPVNPGVSVHVKLAIADVGDEAFDSNVLLGSPNDCGSFNTDAATVGPNDTDPPDAPNITVKYDPRELVPENQPNFEANAARVALEVRKRADRAVARYRELGLVANDTIEIRLLCDLGLVDPLNIDIGLIPDGSDAFVEAENKIKVRASAIRNAFKPIIEAGFPQNGDWNTAAAYWASVIDHEVMHTLQVKKIGSGVDALDQLIRGNRLLMESGAMLGQDLQTDADNLPENGPNWHQYLDFIKPWFADQPSIDQPDLSTPRHYQAQAVLQYWGERFGSAGPTLEHRVAEWYMRLIQPPTFLELDRGSDIRLAVMQEVLGNVDLYDALRDFWVAAYARRASNVAGTTDFFDKRFRFLDEEAGLPGAAYAPLQVEGGNLNTGRLELVKTRAAPLPRASAEAYEIDIPSGVTRVKVTYSSGETGGFGPGGWFPGSSPTRLAFIPFAPDNDPNNSTTGIATLKDFATGHRPDQGEQHFLLDVAGRSKLGIIVVASQDDAAYTMVLETVGGGAGLVVDQPTSANPSRVVAGQANQPIYVLARPTLNGGIATGLSASSFTATVGGNAARVTQAVRIQDTYWMVVDPLTTLSAGTYNLSITFAGVTSTRPNAVVAEAPQPAPAPKAADGVEAVATSGNVRAQSLFPTGGAAGTPIHLGLMLSEPLLGTVGASVTVSITDPAGITRTFPLRDRGGDGDTLQDDGVYGADVWATDLPGIYSMTIAASGTNSAGTAFTFSLPGSVTLTAKSDGDGDGVANSVEALFGMNPAVADDQDHDHDGLSLSAELRRGTNPWTWDTDGGGENDASEVSAGRNPLAAADDGAVRLVLLSARSLDGNRVELTTETNDGTGSVEIYRVALGDVNNRTLVSTAGGARTTFVDGPLPDGQYLYAVIAVGPTGARSAPLIQGPYVSRSDATYPTARMVLEGGQWETADRDVTVAFFDISEPVTAMRIAESEAALISAPWLPFQETSTFLIGSASGDHQIYGQVRDASGLMSAIMSGVVEHDPAPPSSILGSIPAILSADSVSIPFTATDSGTFIANVELWVRYRATTAAPWGSWTLETAASTSPIDYTFAHGEGFYEFYSIAADGAGNREAAPATADTSTQHVSGDTTPPTVPGNVVATAVAWNRINLTWSASTDAFGVIRYEISRGGTMLSVVSGTTTSFIDWSVSPLTSYAYTIRAFDEVGNGSAPSTAASATTPAYSPPPDTVAPSAPPSVSAGNTSQGVNVFWTRSTDNVELTSYTILRNGTALATVNADNDPELVGQIFVDRSASHGSTYTYTVRAHDAAGNSSALSPGASVTTPACCNQTFRPLSDIAKNGFTAKSGSTLYTQLREVTPDADTTYVQGPYAKAGFATVGVGFTNVNSGTSIQIQWNAKRVFQSGTTGTVSTRVELYTGNMLLGRGLLRSLGSSYVTYTENFTNLPTTGFTDLRVKIDQVSASTKTASRVTWLSVVVTSPPPPDSTPPSVPSGLAGTTVSDRQINLTWNGSTDTNGVQGYLVYRNGVRITTLPVGSTSYRSLGLSPSTSYEYRVLALDGSGNTSALSGPIFVTTASAATPPADTSAPTVPTWGTTTCVNPNRIDLAWNASTDNRGVQGYRVFRDGVQVGTLTVGSTSFSDTGLSLGVQYVYTLRAIDGSGNLSATSAARFGTTCPNA